MGLGIGANVKVALAGLEVLEETGTSKPTVGHEDPVQNCGEQGEDVVD